jgi:clan AA aspartic protease
MGKVYAKALLVNHIDEMAVELGVKRTEEVREVEVNGLVDTGAMLIVLPQTIADQLGLTPIRKVTVRYADERRARKSLVRDIRVEIIGRDMVTEGLIEPKRTEVLIGRIVLEGLDLKVDATKGIVIPNPESPDTPLIDLI